MKLNLFSPLPPARSDIANYATRVAAALARIADVTLWTSQSEPPEVPPGLPVQRFEPGAIQWDLLHQADVNIYNIGNNAPFHRDIFAVAREVPGLVIVHDSRLQHFFAGLGETTAADQAQYLDRMLQYYGKAGLADAQAFVEGRLPIQHLVDRYPLTAAAAENALAVVMHNGGESRKLVEQTRTPVFTLPLPYTMGELRPYAPPGPQLRLLVFGFIGLNRRLDSILAVMASSADTAIRLDIYGPMEEPDRIAAEIGRLGLSDRVQVHGFVPEAELDAAITAADLVLNLRFPSMGEASGSQLRIWDAAAPSLVTRVDWYAELPGDSVFFVEPDTELDSIRGYLTELRRDPARFRKAGLRGREVLAERHDAGRYATALLACLDDLDGLHARRASLDLARVAAQRMMEAGGVAGMQLGTDQVASAIGALGGSHASGAAVGGLTALGD